MTGSRILIAVLALIPLLGAGGLARAAELLVVQQPGCGWCRHFEKEIALAWPLTEEGRRAPLRRVNLAHGWPDDLDAIPPERLTPTFILVDDGREIGRLRGYPGDHFFWPLVNELLDKLDQ